MSRTGSTTAVLVLALLLAGCCLVRRDCRDEGPGDGIGTCPVAEAPAATEEITAADIARVAALPHYATAVLDLWSGERFGHVTLTVEASGEKVLRANASTPDLLRNVVADIDVTETLSVQGGYLEAKADEQSGEVGVLAVNGEDGLILQAAVGDVRFEAQPSGIFALTFSATRVEVWPPEERAPTGRELAALEKLKAHRFRLVGRLLGTCMGKLERGAPARVMDLSTVPECEAILGHL